TGRLGVNAVGPKSCYESAIYRSASGPSALPRLAGAVAGLAPWRAGSDRARRRTAGRDGPRLDREPAHRLSRLGSRAVAAPPRAQAAAAGRAGSEDRQRQPLRGVRVAAGGDRALHHRALLAAVPVVADFSSCRPGEPGHARDRATHRNHAAGDDRADSDAARAAIAL